MIARSLPANRVPAPASLPLGFPPDTILTRDQLALALSVSVDTIERAGIPASYALGSRCPRYIWKDVVAWFQHGGNVT